jgi:hypothetical protein
LVTPDGRVDFHETAVLLRQASLAYRHEHGALKPARRFTVTTVVGED